MPDTDVKNNACVSKYVHKVRAYVYAALIFWGKPEQSILI